MIVGVCLQYSKSILTEIFIRSNIKVFSSKIFLLYYWFQAYIYEILNNNQYLPLSTFTLFVLKGTKCFSAITDPFDVYK